MLNHALAGVSALIVSLVILIETYYTDSRLAGGGGTLTDAIFRILVGGMGAAAAICLWVRMVADYIQRRPNQHSAFWGLALFLAMYLGALAYFWWIWRPRRQSEASASAA
jgi:hypothetical protein